MNAWVLIVLQITAGGGQFATFRYGVTMQEFHSNDSCRAAAQAILRMDASRSSAGNGILAMECVKK